MSLGSRNKPVDLISSFSTYSTAISVNLLFLEEPLEREEGGGGGGEGEVAVELDCLAGDCLTR